MVSEDVLEQLGAATGQLNAFLLSLGLLRC
jgi:hypothetical protein